MTGLLTPILSEHWGEATPWKLDTYQSNKGYEALRKALTMEPSEVLNLIKDSDYAVVVVQASPLG